MSPNITENSRYHLTDEQCFRLAEHSLQNGRAEGRLTSSDVELIQKYTRRIKSNVSAGRYQKITSMLCCVRRYFPVEFSQADEDDFLDALSNIKYAKHADGKNKGVPYRQNTIIDWLKITKRFYLFLEEAGLTSVPRKTIEGLKIGGYDKHTKRDSDVLTAEEIGRIIDAAKSAKYKAYLGLLYETGARSIELSRLQWKDIKVEQWGCLVSLKDYKAGSSPKVRVVPVVTYAKYLHDWRSQYSAGNPSGDSLVFVTPSGKSIEYRGILKAVNMFCQKAGVDKKVTLHIFRHSRITHCLQSGMSETLCKKCFWGNSSTGMIEVYSHLTSADLQNSYLQMAGVQVPDEHANTAPQPVQCPVCLKVMPPNSRFCSQCGAALSKEAAADVSSAEKTISEKLSSLTDIEKLKFMQFLQQK